MKENLQGNYRTTDVKEIRVIYEKNDKEETTSSTTDEESRFGEYTDRARCEICGKTYYSYMRTLYDNTYTCTDEKISFTIT